MSTLAIQVRLVFKRLSDQSNSAPNLLLGHCWREVLKTPDDNYYGALGLIESALQRLIRQVGETPALESDGRATAQSVLNGFTQCLKIEHMNTQAKNFSVQLSADRIGSLQILASALRGDADERVMDKPEIDVVLKELEAVQASVAESQINIVVKAILLRHITFLIWALHNMDLVGVSGVYDAMARAVFFAADIPDEPNGDEPGAQSAKSKFFAAAGRLYRGLSVATNTDQAGLQGLLYHDGKTVLGHLPMLTRS